MTNAGLLAMFVVFAVITWVAGIWLTRTTDAIDSKYQLGSAFGGLLILGIATSLPEIAVVVSAALQKHYGMIIGTLIGGIAIQTAVIAILDVAMKSRKKSLTFSAASLILVLEGAMVVLVTVASMLAIRTPVVLPHTDISMTSVLIFGLWLGGLWLIHHARRGLPWKAEAVAALPGRGHKERRAVINHKGLRKVSMTTIWLLFIFSAVVTLVAGVGIQVTGNKLANAYHINSGLFAATFIAFAGALPNISTGIASIRIGDFQLAMSDIFGGNAFLPALFVVCDLITRNAVMKNATSSDVWFAALGVLLTTIYIIGLIVRSRRTVLRMGFDSVAVLVLYVAGIASLLLNGG